MNRKKLLIVCLAGVNIAALLGIMAVTSVPRAEAQPFIQTDYLLYVGAIQLGQEALYIIDLASQRMEAIGWDESKGQVIYYRGRDLARDFRGQPVAEERPGYRGRTR